MATYGTATVTAGTTEVTVAHTFGAVPAVVSLESQDDLGTIAAHVEAKTDTTFKIVLNSADPFNDHVFAWAIVSGISVPAAAGPFYCSAIDVDYAAQVKFTQLEFGSQAAMDTYIETALIPQAQKLIDSYCGRQFFTKSGTLIFDGTGKALLFLLPEYTPFLGVSGGTIQTSPIDVLAVKVHDQFLELYGAAWTTGKKNVTIVGSYGYVAVPDDIRFTCAQICANSLVDMVRRKMFPQAFLAQANAGGEGAPVQMASSSIFTKPLKENLEGYRATWVDVG